MNLLQLKSRQRKSCFRNLIWSSHKWVFSESGLHWCPTSECNSWSQTLGVWALCPDNPLVIAVVSGYCRWQQWLGRASADHGRFIITHLSTAPRIMRDWLVSGFQQGPGKYFLSASKAQDSASLNRSDVGGDQNQKCTSRLHSALPCRPAEGLQSAVDSPGWN